MRKKALPLSPSLAALPLLLVTAACGERTQDTASAVAGAPIVLVSIDTLRSDRLPAYGYDGVQTPALDRLRQDSILYQRAYAPIPLTLPAHATMLTGLLPPEHGVRDNMGYRLDTEGIVYLPRILRRAGYATGAMVSSFVLRGASGLAEGFDLYDDRIEFKGLSTELGSVQRPGGETLQRAVEWLREVAERPFFLFFHIYEPHTPYEPPEPWASRYGSKYDGEVAAADAIVGSLLDELRRLGIYQRAVVLLTSDHGEGLGEHDYWEHGPFLYREALQVPLLLKLPENRRAGETVAAPAQLPDIAPTLLELVGEEIPADLPGVSLLSLGPDTAPRRLFAETFYPRIHFGWSELASMIEYPFHYIHGPDPELYDLEADPDETVNVLRRERRVATELRRALDGIDRELRPPEEVDAETRSRLAALGYVGSVAAVGDGPLPDPKTRVGSLAGMREAFLDFYAGRYERAADRFQQVLAVEPGMVDGWENLGHALLRLGRTEEAWRAYERAVELSGGAAHVALPAANALLRLGRLDEARLHAELAAPSTDAAHDILAQIAVRQGRLEDAERHIERALATRVTRVGPLITQADLRLRQERFGEAIELTERAEEELGPETSHEVLRGMYFIRGSAYARLGEAEEAEKAFLQEIELSPDELDPYAHLAFLYALLGRGPEAGSTLQRMVTANPTPAAYAVAVKTLREMGDETSAERLRRQALRRWPDAPELGLL